jgi:rubrerythrin
MDVDEGTGKLIEDIEKRCPSFKNKADFVEVKNGEWIKKGNEKRCSVCGFIYYSNNDEWNFCPNCGAKMYKKR